MALLTSKFIRSPAAAVIASAALLGSCVAAFTIDRLRETAQDHRPAPSLIPIISFVLILGVAVVPLRPARALALGVLLLMSCGLAAQFGDVPVQANLLDFVSAGTAVAVSVIIATRSTSQRIRVHHAHLSAMTAEQGAENARERALLAESAVTMKRLAASLSHELNTPIGALKSATETLTRCVQKYASFATGSRMPQMVQELSTAIRDSTARLSETVGRIQRFANLDRSAIRLIDINELVQDAVALMNPPSVSHIQVALNLEQLPPIWCRPHGLSVAMASILNEVLENGIAVTIDTYATEANVVVKLAQACPAGVPGGARTKRVEFCCRRWTCSGQWMGVVCGPPTRARDLGRSANRAERRRLADDHNHTFGECSPRWSECRQRGNNYRRSDTRQPVSAGHPFYEHLNGLLDEKKFDDFVEDLCLGFYAEKMGRPGLAPGIYFRLLMVGYFEGIDSERGIAWRASDSLSIRSFVRIALDEMVPDHSTISRTRRLIDVETHQAVFQWVLAMLA